MSKQISTRLQNWDELLQQEIIAVPEYDQIGGRISILFRGNKWVRLKSRLMMAGLDFYPEHVDETWTNLLDPEILIGRKIAAVTVPFVSDDVRVASEVLIRFYDNFSCHIASEDRYEPVLIDRIEGSLVNGKVIWTPE